MTSASSGTEVQSGAGPTGQAGAATASDCPVVDFQDVSITFGQVQAVRDIDLTVGAGEFLAIIGPSGCGKSTLLRIVGGLVTPTSGVVTVGGSSPADNRAKHPYGFLFQTPVMLPWLRMIENVALAGKLIGLPAKERLARAKHWIDRVGLSGFDRRMPHELSGGMRQRAALARAMTLAPSLLLMDEPFGALDEITRMRVLFEVMESLEGQKATVMLVTHSIDEAILMSDRIAVMSPHPGRIRTVLENTVPWPRNRATLDAPAFLEMRHRLRELIEADLVDNR